MKAKLGIILVLLCVVSFFIYDARDIKKTNKMQKETLISGRIVNAKNDIPIEGATIAIQGGNPKSLSNANGEYAIVARGDQELVFKHPKYRSLVVEGGDTKLIKMEAIDSTFVKGVEDGFSITE